MIGRRVSIALMSLAAAGLALTACGGTSGAARTASKVSRSADASCAQVSGKHHARLVVEESSKKIVSSCVGFSKPTISAVSLLHHSGIEFGTEATSTYGLGICQADDVPAHYTTCFPSDAPYWALFTSRNAKKWVMAATGVSHITVHPGESIGLRYDSASQKNPSPPASPHST